MNNDILYHHGRRVIEIPLSEETITPSAIIKYLPRIMSLHAENVEECLHFDDVYRGRTNIFNKIRTQDNVSNKNTIVSENHAHYMINFSKGYMLGNPIRYSCEDESVSTDDLKYINKFMREQSKSTKDLELGESFFKYGNAYRLVKPKPYGRVVNYEKEAPFELVNLDNKSTFVVYSSHYDKKKLFGGIITTLDTDEPGQEEYEILIYTREWSHRFKCHSKLPIAEDVRYIESESHSMGHVPIVEFYTNTARLGIIDIVETILDAVDYISSDAVDNIDDFVNSILAIYNMEIKEGTKAEIERERAIALKTNDPSRPADAKYLVNALNQADVITKYEKLLSVAYGIVGVPMPMQKNSSGGDTGEARALGNGWENAEVIARQNEEPLKQGEYKVLEMVLYLCRQLPSCPINELFVSDIEVNFNRTKGNNLLVKTQSLQTLVGMNMPLEIALNLVDLTANPHEVATEWQGRIDKAKEEAIANQEAMLERQKANEQENNDKQDNSKQDDKDAQ